ncbi:MAG: ATP-dependent Clp protease proteolytic subunit [Aeromonas sp.]|uniref:ATP-dependent Clp protease proteolytic subunit n=1 Tax=Aeromonas sp. TaxID=647 RepID=UPI003D6C6192
MLKKIFMLLTLAFPLHAHANSFYVKADSVNNADVDKVALYFNAGINPQTVAWLLAAIDEIDGNFRNTKYIDIYLNSEGGDMDSGYIAYEALRKNPMKLNMINASMVGSAATMIYCASSARYAMPMASFLLHPAAAANEINDYLKPDQAQRILDDAEKYNSLFRTIYSSCTKIPAEELKAITSSESRRATYNIENAKKVGLVNQDMKKPTTYPVTYYITDMQN